MPNTRCIWRARPAARAMKRHDSGRPSAWLPSEPELERALELEICALHPLRDDALVASRGVEATRQERCLDRSAARPRHDRCDCHTAPASDTEEAVAGGIRRRAAPRSGMADGGNAAILVLKVRSPSTSAYLLGGRGAQHSARRVLRSYVRRRWPPRRLRTRRGWSTRAIK